MATTNMSEVDAAYDKAFGNLPKELQDSLVDTFDFNDKAYRLPCPIKRLATQRWALVVFGIETTFLITCLTLNLIHFIYHYIHPQTVKENIADPTFEIHWKVLVTFVVTMIQIFIGFLFETLLLAAILSTHKRLAKRHPGFQLTMMNTLIIDSIFALTSINGGYDERQFYISYKPPLILFLAILSLVFVPIQLYLYFIIKPTIRLMLDYRKFKIEKAKLVWQHKKKMFYAMVDMSVRQLEAGQNMDELLADIKSRIPSTNFEKENNVEEILDERRSDSGFNASISPDREIAINYEQPNNYEQGSTLPLVSRHNYENKGFEPENKGLQPDIKGFNPLRIPIAATNRWQNTIVTMESSMANLQKIQDEIEKLEEMIDYEEFGDKKMPTDYNDEEASQVSDNKKGPNPHEIIELHEIQDTSKLKIKDSTNLSSSSTNTLPNTKITFGKDLENKLFDYLERASEAGNDYYENDPEYIRLKSQYLQYLKFELN